MRALVGAPVAAAVAPMAMTTTSAAPSKALADAFFRSSPLFKTLSELRRERQLYIPQSGDVHRIGMEAFHWNPYAIIDHPRPLIARPSDLLPEPWSGHD